MAVPQGTKSVKKAPVAKKTNASPSHPPYIQMITEALVALKERTGSSSIAIAKHIEEEQKVRGLPANFKKLLLNQLNKSVASGKLVKVKNSFKLSPVAVKAASAPATEKPKAKAVKAKATSVKPKAKEVQVKTKVTTVKAKVTTVKAKAKVLPAKKKLATGKSPVKKVVPTKAKKVKSVKSPAKKVVPTKAKKVKSVKSPVKKAPATKRARK